ncbi:hypothetical protein K3217_05975 [bacterium BD-1]|uniref:DUF4097 family beta strand repeat-containing protein n=1 Tax=Arenimonas sp. TaxID=1872635 RepID=UPI001E43EFE6|nr:hypothetical protein [Ottowia caeni]
MKRLALLALLLPASAFATDCEFNEPRSLALDLEGVRIVRFEVNQNDLRLGATTGAGGLTARACASDPEYFPQLVLEQRRSGDTLLVRAERRGYATGILFKPTYAYLEINAQLPAGVDVELDVGSGDAWVSGLRSVRAEVGSGDIELRDIAGLVRARVGSGDVTVEGAGELDLRSVGSGDFEASDIRGPARVGSVGSGDLTLAGVKGDVELDEIGSGDAEVSRVDGSVRIGRVGSGDVRASDVGGDLVVRRIHSGDVSHRGVRGRVELPSED